LAADIDWWAFGWKTQLRQISQAVRAGGTQFGIIYDATPTGTDVEWTTEAQQNFADVEGDTTLVPDIALIMSWEAQPSHVLPETQEGTMTYLVDRYIAARSSPPK
jgi:hypothetical protein